MANRRKLEDNVIYINRVMKAVSGGTNMSFSTMVVVGDLNGRFLEAFIFYA